jgi:hypothetical protein
MTTEFRIDRLGVYRRRDGEHVCLWPTFSTGVMQWVAVSTGNRPKPARPLLRHPLTYRDDGCYWASCRISEYDIVAYVGPLPTEILARMREALALAEGDEPQSPTVEQRLRHKCRVCGEWPNERGVLHHGRGCYVTHKGGGGCTYVDFEQEPKQ